MAKELSEMEQGMKAYLLKLLREEAEKDELFAESFVKKNKSINECVKYIYGELFELAKKDNTKAAGLDDPTVVGMAKHYFDEDDIKIKEISGGRVSSGTVNTTAYKAHVTQAKKVEKKKDAQMSLDLFAEDDVQNDSAEDVKSSEVSETKVEVKNEESKVAPVISLFGDDLYNDDDEDNDDDDEYDSNTANEDYVEDNEEDE